MEADNIIILWVLLWFMQVCKEWLCMFAVAFCEEAVDWNLYPSGGRDIMMVAFCEEAVDWNWLKSGKRCHIYMSLSARKLWIEIIMNLRVCLHVCVAFCEEAVDWNRMWVCMLRMERVAFCEEAVDWNMLYLLKLEKNLKSRFLRGSCGLKLYSNTQQKLSDPVAFCEEAVDWNSPARWNPC